MTDPGDRFEERLRDELGRRPPKRITVEGARDAAVLIPIVAAPEPTLIFTRRTDTLPSHRGQISFPGGSIDPGDRDPAAAALREAYEEIGLDQSAVRVVGELDSLQTFVSGFVVVPVIGWLQRTPTLSPNPREVAEVLHVPLGDLTNEIRREPGFVHGGRSYPTEAWVWRGNVIWGVTARILRVFIGRLAAAGLADPPAGTAFAWPDDRVSR